MNIRDKIKKASVLRNKEAYIQAANNKFGFKVEGKGTYIWTSEEAENESAMWKAENNLSKKCIKKEVKSYELKVVDNNNFWVITELDGTVIVIDTIEYTMAYYMRPRTKKTKVRDWKLPHKCYGYYTDRSCVAIEEADLAESEEKDSYYRWRASFVKLIKETFK
ncbi:MAG: hypothetical protein HOI51_02580 [Nitrosomonadales bacterium]|nr:hypothetical protein [Nitrosomonadales bacterium]